VSMVGDITADFSQRNKVRLGPGKFFQPTKGLRALLAKTGTYTKTLRQPSTHIFSRPFYVRSFVEVVKSRNKVMVAQGNGARGGGGREVGFAPGFRPWLWCMEGTWGMA
jgi:hypothetical protein